MILKFSSEGVLTYSNPVAAAVLGIDPSRKKKYLLKGTSFPKISVHQDFAESLISSLMGDPDLVLKKEIEYPSEKNSLWISWTFRSIPAPSDPHLDILCIGTDISLMRNQGNSLIESEGQIRGILDASKDLIDVLDHEKCYSYVNAAYEKIFTCPGEEIRGKSIADHPLPGEPEFWNRTVHSVILTRLSNRVEVNYSGESGETCLDCYLIPYFPGTSGKMHILLDFRDITVLKGGSVSLWEEESALQEIGKQVSRLIPMLNLNSWIAPIPLIVVLLLAFTGNYI